MTPSPTNRKVGYTWFACNSCRVKKRTENKLKVHINIVHVYVKKIISKDTPKIPIQWYNCTECNSTFDAMHKLKKRTRKLHEGKFVKSPERKSEPKINKKNINSNKDELKKQVTAEGEKWMCRQWQWMLKKLENLQDLLTQTGQENEQLKSDITQLIEFKEKQGWKVTKSRRRK